MLGNGLDNGKGMFARLAPVFISWHLDPSLLVSSRPPIFYGKCDPCPRKFRAAPSQKSCEIDPSFLYSQENIGRDIL